MVPLEGGQYGFGQVLADPHFVFFDLRANQAPDIQDILHAKPLFVISVMRYAITRGVWPVIGHGEISPEINEQPVRFIKDIASGEFFLTYTGEERTPTTLEEAAKLERAAVWDPEHVSDRLSAHFEGRACIWTEQLRAK